MSKIIYVDNAATTPLSKKVKKAYIEALDLYGNPSSIHSTGQQSMVALAKARTTIAKLLNTEAHNILFTSGGSESNNQVLNTAKLLGRQYNKKHIISSKIEHLAILNTLKYLEENEGFKITLLDVQKNKGIIDLNELSKSITKDTIMVSIMYVNNELGTINPINEVATICKRNNILFHTDAVQASSMLSNINLENIDFLSLSAHKFYGPKGVGILYYNSTSPKSFINGGHQEFGLRAGTENLPGIVATAKAFEELFQNNRVYNEKVDTLNRIIRMELKHDRHFIEINGDSDKKSPYILNVLCKNINGDSLVNYLDSYDICVSTGSACTTGDTEPSNVLLSLGLSKEDALSSIRISLSHNLSEKDALKIGQSIINGVKTLRNLSSN